MDKLIASMRSEMEQAAILGLCREGQLEIAVQEARLLRPDFSVEQLLLLAENIYDEIQQ